MSDKPAYKVYRLTVAEAAAMFAEGISSDPTYATRPIAFYFADQFTRQPLACPPSSDARRATSQQLTPPSSDARQQLTPPSSDARQQLTPPSSDVRQQLAPPSSDVRNVICPATERTAVQTSFEQPTKEAEREVDLMALPLGKILEISDVGERQFLMRRRALEIGNDNSGLWTDLCKLVSCEFPEVRRLAASAMKKRMERDGTVGRIFFRPLIDALVNEKFPQVQQYMLSALKRCAKEADQKGIDYLKDVVRDPTLPLKFRETANEIVHTFETHKKLKESLHQHWCHRCKRPITKEESAAGLEKYGKPYCKRCLDERLLGDVDFERMVDEAKLRRTTDGVAVQSLGEKRIADWLVSHGIRYEYDERFRIVEDTTIRPDFYLREFDLYIEYWGMNTGRYNANRQKKHKLYQREGRKLISLSFEDDVRLEEKLQERLSFHIPLLTGKSS